MAKESGTKVKLLLSKVLGANERYVFYIYLKTIETFWPSQCWELNNLCDSIVIFALLYWYANTSQYIKSLVDNFILSALQDVFFLLLYSHF